MSNMGTQISCKFLHQFKQKTSLTIAVWCQKITLLWNCGWVVFWNTQNYIDSRCVWTEISWTDWKWEPSWQFYCIRRIGKWCIYNMWIDIWNIRCKIEDARTSIFLTFLWGRVSLLISKTGVVIDFVNFEIYNYTYSQLALLNIIDPSCQWLITKACSGR